MSDNNKPKINVPRFNLTWLYVIIAYIFAFLYLSGDEGSATKEVNYTEIQEMLWFVFGVCFVVFFFVVVPVVQYFVGGFGSGSA